MMISCMSHLKVVDFTGNHVVDIADGVGELCWPRLLAIWPVLLTVGLLTLLSPAPTWLLFTRHSRNLNKVDFLCM